MKTTITIIALVLLGVGAFYWLANTQTTNTTIDTITPVNNITHENAELVAFGFIQDFIAVVPPEIDESAKERIISVLSLNAKDEIRRETISSDLARFIGVQDVPDQGASVEDLQIISPTESYLVVGLNYSGGRVLRNVHLIVEDGQWKVDRVSTPQVEVETFDRTGNVVQNNPGMKPNVWYLVYESQGQPAQSVELEFTQSSICAEGVANNTCDTSTLTQGARVRILGEEASQDVIRVIRLEVN